MTEHSAFPSIPTLHPSPPSSFDAQPLLHLLSATKPDTVDSLITDAFRLRSSGLDSVTSDKWRAQLNKSPDDVQQLFTSLSALVRMAVFHSSIQSKASVAGLFPADFHPALVSLLSKLIAGHLPAFRQSATSSLPSPPLLRSFSTSVHTRASSSLLHHLNSPTIFLTLTLDKQPTVHPAPSGDSVEVLTCELKQEALKTMLSGLEKIQQQLAAMQ